MKHFLSLLSLFFCFSFKPFDAELKNYNYPFKVQFQTVKVKDKNYRMAWMLKEASGKKTGTVLLLHGKNFSGAYWEKTANDLSKAGFDVVIPDQIGFGKSSKPDSFPFSMPLLSSLTHEIMQGLKLQNYMIVGHSMGGMLATRYALMYPSEVSKLILVNPIGLEDWKTKVPYKDVREIYKDELQSNAEKIKAYQQNVYYAGNWKPEYDKGIEMLVGWTLHKDYPIVAWNAALTTQMVFSEPVVYEFKNLSMPTLLIIGTRDRTAVGKSWASSEVQKELGRYDLLGKEVAKKIPHGKLVEFENVGHMPQIEVYDRYIAEVLAFLK